QHSPAGITTDIGDEAKAYQSLVALFEQSSARFVHHDAYLRMGASLTYGELDDASRCLAASLHSTRLKKGDRIAIMMPNLLQYPVCLFGAWRAGAVVVNTNPLYTPTELEHQLSDSGAEIIIIAENFAHTLQKALPRTKIKHIVLTGVGDMLGTVKGGI